MCDSALPDSLLYTIHHSPYPFSIHTLTLVTLILHHTSNAFVLAFVSILHQPLLWNYVYTFYLFIGCRSHFVSLAVDNPGRIWKPLVAVGPSTHLFIMYILCRRSHPLGFPFICSQGDLIVGRLPSQNKNIILTCLLLMHSLFFFALHMTLITRIQSLVDISAPYLILVTSSCRFGGEKKKQIQHHFGSVLGACLVRGIWGLASPVGRCGPSRSRERWVQSPRGLVPSALPRFPRDPMVCHFFFSLRAQCRLFSSPSVPPGCTGVVVW